MKQQKKERKKGKKWIVILLILVLIGVFGGFIISNLFFHKAEDGFMSNKEANRLIRYLSIMDYNYSDRLGSSFKVGDAKKLLDAAGIQRDQINLNLSYKPGFLPLTKRQFESIYDDMIKILELERLRSDDLYIYEIDSANDEEIDGVLYEVVSTSAGEFYMEKDYGMDSSYVGKVAQLYLSNNEIILCLGLSDATVTIPNAYAQKVENEEGQDVLYAYINGAVHKLPSAKNSDLTKLSEGLCDIDISNEGVCKVSGHMGDLKEGKVTSVLSEVIYLEGEEEPYYLSPMFYVYKTKGTFKATKSAGNLIGYESVSFYLEDHTVQAAIVTEDIYKKDIRVLIGTSNYEGYSHSLLTLTSDEPFTVTYGEQVDEYEAGQKLEFRNGSKEIKDGVARIKTKSENGRITLTNVERQSGNPSYRGVIELSKKNDGVIVINELPVEEYLYGVVPSEMPVNYEMEALKTQAICARAYAYRQMENDTFGEYGAHLDDSVACQVYNNVKEDERGIYAVDDTYGVVPCYDGEVIQAFFFSTSCGTTCNNTDVWGGNPEAYLLDTFETELNDIADLSNEETFKAFMKGELGTGFIEETEPFYRWYVKMNKKQVTDAVNSHLYERIQAMSENILAQNAVGKFEKKVIKSVGDVTDIQVTKRGDSGIIKEMVITGTQETILVKGQTNVRALLSPEATKICKQDGSVAEGWTSLPSAYFYVSSNDEGFVIHGGGFGHGVGMSQNGANDMAKLGYQAGDIISHYYTAVELKDMYELMGK